MRFSNGFPAGHFVLWVARGVAIFVCNDDDVGTVSIRYRMRKIRNK